MHFGVPDPRKRDVVKTKWVAQWWRGPTEWGMYLRRCYRVKDGKRHAYWALVESVRTVRGPRQRVVAYLGELEKQAAREAAAGLRQPVGGILAGTLSMRRTRRG